MVVLPNVGSAKNAVRVAEKILAELHQPIPVDGQTAVVGASIGISIYPSDASTDEELLRHADGAMYRVKATGKNGLLLYDH